MNGLNLAYKTKREIVNARLMAFAIDYFIIMAIFLCVTKFNEKIESEPFSLFILSTSVINFIIFETFIVRRVLEIEEISVENIISEVSRGARLFGL